MEKELPQPQEDLAFGFFTWNDAPTRSSTKSISAPASRSSEVSSTTTFTPPRSNRWSSTWTALSNEKPYWKPEQPPPETLSRSIRLASPSAEIRLAMRLTALSDRLTWRSGTGDMSFIGLTKVNQALETLM